MLDNTAVILFLTFTLTAAALAFVHWCERRRWILALALLSPALALAQTPDHRGEVVLDKPVYRGERASAPIPAELHIRNEGGSDGAGLCVVSSILANGLYQKVPALAGGKDSKLWRLAKSRPGGHFPEKLANLVGEAAPGEKYASRVGTGSAEDRELLERVNRAGYPVGVTMNTGKLYGYMPIHHMVSLVHYRKNGWTMIVDNNRPGFYSAFPSSEFHRRWPDMGTTWMWFWTRLPVSPASQQGVAVGVLLCFFALAALAVVEINRRTPAALPESDS